MSEFNRREFVKLLGLGAASAALPAPLLGCGGRDPLLTPAELAATGPRLEHRTPASLMAASRQELDVDLHVISGTLPRDIFGHAFTICALPFASGGPAFSGDGLIYRVDFGRSRPGLRTRLSKTPSWFVDEATRGTDKEFVTRGFVRMSSVWGARNQANTAFVTMGERIMATYDAGRPFEFDPVSMAMITPVGAQSEWRSSMPEGMLNGPFDVFFSTAHPFYDDHTGFLFSVNYRGGALAGDGEAFTDVVRWDGAGDLERWSLVLEDGSPVEIQQSTHQIGVTRDYVVIMDTAFYIEGEQIVNPDFSAAQSPDTVIYIARRADLKPGRDEVQVRRLVIAREAVHFLCDYDDAGGQIVMHLAHSCASDASEWVRADDVLVASGEAVRDDVVGVPPASTDIALMARYVIDADAGRVVDMEMTFDETYTWSAALYTHRGGAPAGRHDDLYWVSAGFSADILTQRVYDLYADYPYRTIALADLPTAGKSNTLFRMATARTQIADGYIFPPGRFGFSPQFMPRAGSRGPTDGYLICTVISDDTSWVNSTGDEFWIFDAANLQQGPLCRLAHPLLNMPFTIHTAWLPELRSRTAEYRISAREDFAPRVAAQPDEVKQVFEEVVYPHFGG